MSVRTATSRRLLRRSFVIAFAAAFLIAGFSWTPSPVQAYSSKGEIAKKKIDKRTRARGKVSKRPPRIRAKAVLCVDLKSCKTLVARNADRRLPIASLTKLMTAMVALDKMPLKKRVRVPRSIRRVPRSVVGLRPGDLVTVRDLLHGLLISSGNDCAETLARTYPGGKRAFMRAMNRKARRMGARKTRFYTPSGLDRRIVIKRKGKRIVRVRSNVSTAREFSHIAHEAFKNDTIRSICLKKRYVMASGKFKRGYQVRTTNKFLRAGKLPLRGGKTGYTSRAGHCLATKFGPGKDSLLIVVLGSPDHFRDTRLAYRKAVRKIAQSRKRARSHRTDHRSKAAANLPG